MSNRVVRITSDGVNPSTYSVPEGVVLVVEQTGQDVEDMFSVEMVGPYEGEMPEPGADDEDEKRCACGRKLDANGEHDGGYGAWCGDETMNMELADAKGRPGATHPESIRERARLHRDFNVAEGSSEAPLLDVLASLARTALDDPEALEEADMRAAIEKQLPGANPLPENLHNVYAVCMLDEIIEALNPTYETRETFVATLTILGSHLAERADVMRDVDADVESGEKAAYERAANRVHDALDVLDEAIGALGVAVEDASNA